MSYGKVTVGFGSPQQHDIEVEDFVKCVFAGDRYIHVSKLVDGTYCLSVENLPSSGRDAHQSMRLGEESFTALLFACSMYLEIKGMDVTKLMQELQAHKNGNIEYMVSDNLTPIKKQ